MSSVDEWSLYDQIQAGKFNFDAYMADEYGNISSSSIDGGNESALPFSGGNGEKKKNFSFSDGAGQQQQSPNMLDNKLYNVTYDEFVTRFVDQLWMNINKEGMYLYMYNFSGVFNESNVPGALDRIRFYARYQLFNFDTRIGQLEKSLDWLVGQFGNSSIKMNAIANVESVHSDNSNNNNSGGGVQGTKAAIVTSLQPVEVHDHVLNRTGYLTVIKNEFNRTLCRAKKLYTAYIVPAEKYTAEQTSSFLEKMRNATVSNWNMIVDYGFKYFTYKLSGNKVISVAPVQAGGGVERVTVMVKRTSDSIFQVNIITVLFLKF
jgi:hypothetical protein